VFLPFSIALDKTPDSRGRFNHARGPVRDGPGR
jgi:hypothetical protein